MTRPRRSDLTHPHLHIYSRGADRQDIFSADRDRFVFEHLLAETVAQFDLDVLAYSLMHNHVHLMVDRSRADVSKAMQHLFGRYARYYNNRTDRTGPLFTGRFGSTEIESDAQLIQCSRYVHLNPLAFVPKRAIAAYRWSSLGPYVGRRDRPEWLSTELVTDHFDSEERHLRYLLTPQPGDDECGRPLRPWATLTLDTVDSVVEAVSGSIGRGPTTRRSIEATARSLAVGAAVELRVAPVDVIAEHHGLSSMSSVRSIARRARVRLADEPIFSSAYQRVVTELSTIARQAGLPTELGEAA